MCEKFETIQISINKLTVKQCIYIFEYHTVFNEKKVSAYVPISSLKYTTTWKK